MSQDLFLMLSTPDGVTTLSITIFSITIRKCDIQHKDTKLMPSVILMIVIYAKCCNLVYCGEFYFGECRGAHPMLQKVKFKFFM